jgi:aryl-alcohol dehydrogenase-like predicted oxidoreductase
MISRYDVKEIETQLHYLDLGKTGLHVSEVSMGCNRLGSDLYPDDHWVNLVRRAVDLGVNLFDTAEVYGGRRSEEMIGRAVSTRDDVFIATKMSAWDAEHTDLSYGRMVEAVEGSLRRLQRDTIDVYQLHSPHRELMERFDWAESMAKLQKQGKIRFRAVALALNVVGDGIWLIEQGVVDVLQLTYNMFDTTAEERLFDLALEHGVGLLCRMPLGRGVLTGKFRAQDEVTEDNRARLDRDHLTDRLPKVDDLRDLAASYPGGMTRLAHHFSLRPRAISAIIPGVRTIEQLAENVAASNGVGLPSEVRARIDAIRAGWE